MELIIFITLWTLAMRYMHLKEARRVALGRLGHMAGIARHVHGPYYRRRGWR